MEMRTLPTVLLLCLAAIVALAIPATAPAAKRSKKPTITRVTPMRLQAGTRVTIRGRYFNARRNRTTVIFRAPSGRSAFVKPSSVSRKKLVLVVPASVTRIVGSKPTRVKLRVLAGKFGPFTSRRLSPVVVPPNTGSGTPVTPTNPGTPNAPGTPSAPNNPGTPPPPPVDCTQGDYDGDLLPGSLEAILKTDPCVKDTDKDGIEDGFEYRSAVDLNNDEYQDPNSSLPYPGSRPYPNPLDPSDGSTDYDGDTLSQATEQALWKFSTTAANRTLSPLTYSDGLQYSVYANHPGQGDRRFPALAAASYSKDAEFVAWLNAHDYRNVFINVHDASKAPGTYGLFDINLNGTESNAERYQLDRDQDGFLSDDERDEDADGLSNAEEDNHRLQPDWWVSCYNQEPIKEQQYYVHYAGTSAFNPDSDGDGVRDGADDQDHDDIPNMMELSRLAASGLNDTEGNRECKLSKPLMESWSEQTPPIYNHQLTYGRVDPFNPCLPDTSSRTCNDVVSFKTPWAPFDESVNWVALN
jgi:hypothetical protein